MSKLIHIKGDFNLGRIYAAYDIGEEQTVERTAIKSLYFDFLNEEQAISPREREMNAYESCLAHLDSSLETYRYYVADFYSQMEKKGIELNIDAFKIACILVDSTASSLDGIDAEIKPICTDILLEANNLHISGLNSEHLPRPESIFLAHILALDTLELISDNLENMMEKQYTYLMEQIAPLYETFIMMDTEIGRETKNYMDGLKERATEAMLNRKPQEGLILTFKRP